MVAGIRRSRKRTLRSSRRNLNRILQSDSEKESIVRHMLGVSSLGLKQLIRHVEQIVLRIHRRSRYDYLEVAETAQSNHGFDLAESQNSRLNTSHRDQKLKEPRNVLFELLQCYLLIPSESEVSEAIA